MTKKNNTLGIIEANGLAMLSCRKSRTKLSKNTEL